MTDTDTDTARRAACECAPFDACACEPTTYTIRAIDTAAARGADASRYHSGPLGPPDRSGMWWRAAAEIDADRALCAAYRECAALQEWY